MITIMYAKYTPIEYCHFILGYISLEIISYFLIFAVNTARFYTVYITLLIKIVRLYDQNTTLNQHLMLHFFGIVSKRIAYVTVMKANRLKTYYCPLDTAFFCHSTDPIIELKHSVNLCLHTFCLLP